MTDEAHRVLMANADAMKRGALPMWTIYDRPSDCPDGFIARRFEVGGGQPVATGDTLTGELEALRQTFWKAGMLKLARERSDEPQIVETWV
jgi:hypothetical protein